MRTGRREHPLDDSTYEVVVVQRGEGLPMDLSLVRARREEYR